MQKDQANLQTTIDFYNRSANDLRQSYDNADMSELHKLLLKILPQKSRVVDIGFGSGRDLSFLKDHGFDVWGIEPSRQFVNIAKERLPDIVDHFYQSSLPDLHISHALVHSFDAVILVAVWMHLPKAVYKDSIEKIVSLLCPSGKIIISYSVTPREGETERYFETVDSTLLEKLCKLNGCRKILQTENEDGLKNRSIRWRTEVYEYDKP